MTKRKNKPDATLRNVRAANKRFNNLEMMVRFIVKHIEEGAEKEYDPKTGAWKTDGNSEEGPTE